MSSTDNPAASTTSTSTSSTTAATPTNSTPSPSTTSTPANPPAQTSTSRRPQRKSTLTQQQKNQKRQRATQDQLVTLELEFNKNPTPTAAVRERIAQEINMTERSVQIWFQNRRAKIKMIAKKSIETGEDCDSIPESMRQYLAMQFDPNKPGGRDLFGRTSGLGGYGSNGGYNSESSHSGKIVIHHFTCHSLSIGSWRRVGQNAMDLVIFYSPEKATMTYYINNDSAGYKIEYPFSFIKNITLESGEQNPNLNGAPARPAGLLVELNRPPLFYMDSSNSGGFYQCGDFTEDQQASRVLIHHLGGPPKVLSMQLAKLVSLEAFQNRLAFNNYAASTPVSPPRGIHRPASQPNQFPLAQVGMYQNNHLDVNLMQRGHKRQRSRSVPAAVDFSVVQNPGAPFQMQQPVSQLTANPGVFAPVPQHQVTQGLPNNLRIDTTCISYGMDAGNYPMSAGAISDYASPSFFTSAPHSETIPMVTNSGSQYNVPFASPTVMGQPATSMPNVSHADPLIADQSPPLSTMHGTGSADMFSFGGEQPTGLSEDGLMLSEMYSKHNLDNFPMATPTGMEATTFDFPMHGMPDPSSNTNGDFPGVVPYDMIDPTST
ncbi:hypothetical protein VTN77DRAFT_9458 [Rasamsonia byssochlamydoides]|uniref:uncharacterized protein n=1 Tax=Rasamsonia byssochlamydoides TaxID=89139 RepID=UPI0037426023